MKGGNKMRRKGDTWEAIEDKVIGNYINRFNSLTDDDITEKIKHDRPEGIKEIRYNGTSLNQHVSKVRRDLGR